MQRTAAVVRDNVTVGIVTMVATAAAMSFGDALVKRISADFGLWQIFVARSLIALPLLAGLLWSTGGLRRLPAGVAGWAVLRSLLLIGMWVSFYAALTMLDLATVATAYYTGPLFITLLSSWLAGEAVGMRRWLAVMAGFAGVLLILRPGEGAFEWPVLLAVLSGLFYALAAIVTRARLAAEAPFVLSAALNLAFLVAGALGTLVLDILPPPEGTVAAHPFLFGPWGPMGAREWATVGLLAVLIVAISTGVAKAYQSAPSAVIATFDYSYLPFAAIWGFVFFASAPDAATLAGMLLIGGAGLAVLRHRPQGG